MHRVNIPGSKVFPRSIICPISIGIASAIGRTQGDLGSGAFAPTLPNFPVLPLELYGPRRAKRGYAVATKPLLFQMPKTGLEPVRAYQDHEGWNPTRLADTFGALKGLVRRKPLLFNQAVVCRMASTTRTFRTSALDYPRITAAWARRRR